MKSDLKRSATERALSGARLVGVEVGVPVGCRSSVASGEGPVLVLSVFIWCPSVAADTFGL